MKLFFKDKKLSTTGTKVQAGYFSEDRKTSFDDGMLWAEQADMMARSDAHIYKALRTVRLPIVSAQWLIEVDVDDPKAEEKKQYVEDVFWDRIEQTQFINQCLTFIKYGFSVFEKVFSLEEVDGYGKVAVLKSCTPISQKTIETFDFDKETAEFKGVRQLGYGDLGRDVFIPANKLMILTFNKEGDDLRGIPPLRSCYRYYRHKDETLTAIRRGNVNASRGVPYVILPEARDTDEELVNSVKTVFKQYSQDKASGFLLPFGCTVDTLKLEYDADKIMETVRYFDRQISGAFSCAFLEIGQAGTSGGYAQSANESDIFLSGLEEIGNQIAETITKHIIKPLVEWRYGRDDYCPRLVVRGINDTDPEARAKTLKLLRDAGLISDSDAVKEQVHREAKLPDYDPREEEEKQQTEGDNTDDAEKPNGKSEAFAQKKKHKATAHIERKAEEMAAIMRRSLSDMSAEYIAQGIADVQQMASRPLPGKAEYTKELADFAIQSAQEAKAIALNDVQITLNETYLSQAEINALIATVNILVESQEQRIQQDATLGVISSITRRMDEAATIKAASKAASDYIESSALSLEATNFVSSLENRSRNEVFQRPETLSRIEYFRFDNPAPKSAICRNLNGKVFTKEEYLSTSYLPPLHHNCKSVIVPIRKNEKVTPEPLKPSGTKEQIAKAEKSIKFDETCCGTT